MFVTATRYTLCAVSDGGPQGARPRETWSEAELLAEGFAANPATLRALQQRLSMRVADAAAACLVHPRTYRGWLQTHNPNPTAVRLLAILAGFVPWDGWAGWECHRGCLFPPGFSKGGIGPGDFHALIFWRQAASTYQQHNAALRARVAELEARLAAREAPAGVLPPALDATG